MGAGRDQNRAGPREHGFASICRSLSLVSTLPQAFEKKNRQDREERQERNQMEFRSEVSVLTGSRPPRLPEDFWLGTLLLSH